MREYSQLTQQPSNAAASATSLASQGAFDDHTFGRQASKCDTTPGEGSGEVSQKLFPTFNLYIAGIRTVNLVL